MILFFWRKEVGFWPRAWLREARIRVGNVPHLHGEDGFFLEDVSLVRLELEEPGIFFVGILLAVSQLSFGEEAVVFVLDGEVVAELQHGQELCVFVDDALVLAQERLRSPLCSSGRPAGSA